jgi:hypothetical protein
MIIPVMKLKGKVYKPTILYFILFPVYRLFGLFSKIVNNHYVKVFMSHMCHIYIHRKFPNRQRLDAIH